MSSKSMIVPCAWGTLMGESENEGRVHSRHSRPGFGTFTQPCSGSTSEQLSSATTQPPPSFHLRVVILSCLYTILRPLARGAEGKGVSIMACLRLLVNFG